MEMIIIGDRIEDEYIIGKCTRLSPEAPVPVVEKYLTEVRSGGAANVRLNYTSLSGEIPTFIYNEKQFTKKTRVIADGHMICRLDSEMYVPFFFSASNHIESKQHFGPAIISDYGKGVVHDTESMMFQLLDRKMRVYVDPDRKKTFSRYAGAHLIKCNQKEFESEIGVPFSLSDAESFCESICEGDEIKHIVVTLGKDGCFVYDYDTNTSLHIPAETRTVVDVTGAGDVFMAALVHYMENEKDTLYKAAEKANKLAGISVGHMGTYVLTKEDIENAVPQKKKKVVFTNGCFDLLHPGHIHLLKESRKKGDKLVVGLNSDASVRRLKGEKRPIINQNARKAMLESFDFVDEVIIFDEDTPLELIKKLSPDIVTKGGDYMIPEVVGYGHVPTVIIITTLEDYSTTGVIDEIIRKS
jgi:D-beta-D-heptose 7-phosphate kinase/D-beta-D-heptose 1-phosphate adenosyltransferase